LRKKALLYANQSDTYKQLESSCPDEIGRAFCIYFINKKRSKNYGRNLEQKGKRKKETGKEEREE
jgi:hypothetical protein